MMHMCVVCSQQIIPRLYLCIITLKRFGDGENKKLIMISTPDLPQFMNTHCCRLEAKYCGSLDSRLVLYIVRNAADMKVSERSYVHCARDKRCCSRVWGKNPTQVAEPRGV